MRVVIAPDKFAGTLTAVEAAQALAAGWRRTSPDDELVCVPIADGGPGFVDVVHAARGGRLLSLTVTGPLGEPTPATVLLVRGESVGAGEASGPVTAYIESAQAAGLHLVPLGRRDPGITTTYGVGELIAAAIDEGAARIVVGLGGSATNDGGAGLLGALGATATRNGQPAHDVLSSGGAGLTTLDSVDLTPARRRVDEIELIAATDVDNPLLGIRGASAGFGPQKGADHAKAIELDGSLAHFSALIGRGPDGRDPAVALGAGAAGGMGYALLCLGAARAAGIETVLTAIGLDRQIASCDLVITGEGSFDWQSLRGKAVTGVAATATQYARPCIVLAGRVGVGRREYAAAGVSAAFSVEENEGSLEVAIARPVEGLEALAQRVARTWGRH